MKKTRSGMTIGLGVPTVLVVFVVMGMCILSLLTYLEATQNRSSTNKEVETVSNYYEADSKAQYLISCIQNDIDYSPFIENEQIDFDDSDGYVFSIQISDKKVLHVVCDKQAIKIYKVMEVQ